MTSDLYEGGSGCWGSFRHHHLALWPVVFWCIRKRLPIVPCRHGNKVAALWSPGKLIGHSSDLKRTCQSNADPKQTISTIRNDELRMRSNVDTESGFHTPVLCMFSSLMWMLQLMLRGRVVWHQGIMGVLMTPNGLLLTVSMASLNRLKVTAFADTSDICIYVGNTEFKEEFTEFSHHFA